LLPLLAIFGLGAWLLRRYRAAARSPLLGSSLAAQVNATLHGGTDAQKTAIVLQYQQAKGLPANGVYSSAVYAALKGDGILAPPDPPDSTDE